MSTPRTLPSSLNPKKPTQKNCCFMENKNECIRKLLSKYSGNGSGDDLAKKDNSIAKGPATQLHLKKTQLNQRR